jgi:hypothetical protein
MSGRVVGARPPTDRTVKRSTFLIILFILIVLLIIFVFLTVLFYIKYTETLGNLQNNIPIGCA